MNYESAHANQNGCFEALAPEVSFRQNLYRIFEVSEFQPMFVPFCLEMNKPEGTVLWADGDLTLDESIKSKILPKTMGEN
jgi:hypothetical protein